MAWDEHRYPEDRHRFFAPALPPVAVLDEHEVVQHQAPENDLLICKMHFRTDICTFEVNIASSQRKTIFAEVKLGHEVMDFNLRESSVHNLNCIVLRGKNILANISLAQDWAEHFCT